MMLALRGVLDEAGPKTQDRPKAPAKIAAPAFASYGSFRCIVVASVLMRPYARGRRSATSAAHWQADGPSPESAAVPDRSAPPPTRAAPHAHASARHAAVG